MVAVKFNHVSKKRKDFSIKNLNFTIPEGYITGFIGPNGSGKTTTIQMMMDLLQINEGDIQIFGTTHKDHHVKQHIGFVYDDLYMYDEWSIRKMKSFIAPLYDNWNETKFQKNLQKFNLPLNKKIKKFSKGMKMKCSLLFALSHEPKLIVMDEPTTGLDPIFRRELIDMLQEQMVRENQTIFLSTHITNDLDRIADYIVFINDGEVLMEKSMEEIREKFHIVKGPNELLDADTRELFNHLQETAIGFTALFEGDSKIFDPFENEITIEQAALEDLMYYMIGGVENVAND